jgi:hypothetical protein
MLYSKCIENVSLILPCLHGHFWSDYKWKNSSISIENYHIYTSIGIHENARETYGRTLTTFVNAIYTVHSDWMNRSIPIINLIGSEVCM